MPFSPKKKGKRAKMKEFLYVGYYIDIDNNFILKVGTTNDLKRRKTEHNRNYRKASRYMMPAENEFNYIWSLPLSKYNTLRYEDKTRQAWKDANIGKFINNDRFLLTDIPKEIFVTIKKTYKIPLVF